MHRVINEYFINMNQNKEWKEQENAFTFAFNTSRVKYRYSPFGLIFGKLSYLPSDKLELINVIKIIMRNYAFFEDSK